MAVGFAYDAGSGAKELTSVFAGTYVIGCIFAVLAVRQAGIFTAVIQPPLLLFGAVPAAYFVFTDTALSSIKDTLINCGYPLIERFPLMFFTSAVVLLIGMARWYTGMSSRRSAAGTTAPKDESSGGGLVAAVSAKVSALLAGLGVDDEADEKADPAGQTDAPPRRRTAARPSRSTSRDGRPTGRTAPPRSRHARPPETEYIEPVAGRPRRPRPSRQGEPPVEPRRKPRSGSTQRRTMPPPDRRTGYERPERRRRFDEDQPPLAQGNGSGTHHPVSRVRYRGEEGEDYAQYRRPPRSPRERADSWEYDI
jgi:hypothetical protein